MLAIENAGPVTPLPAYEPKVCADEATKYLDKDRVTPSQARAYMELLGPDATAFSIFATMDRLTLMRVAAGQRLSAADSKALHEAMSGLTKSHRWPKAIAAVALTVTV